jgi:toxin YoeB
LASADRDAVFSTHFRSDLRYWVEADRSTALRVFQLIEAILRDPLSGIGKPEPLRGEFAGLWSRRITHEHRLIYRIRADRVEFIQARYHY